MKSLEEIRLSLWFEGSTGRFRMDERDWKKLVAALDAEGYAITSRLPRKSGWAPDRFVPDIRRHRADVLTHAVLGFFWKHLDACIDRTCAVLDRRRLAHEVLVFFHDSGFEVVTDEDRKNAGLPPRGAEGWTSAELAAMESRRLEAMTRAVPWLPARADSE